MRVITPGPASITQTLLPSVAAVAATSMPITPPPMTAMRRARSSAARSVRLSSSVRRLTQNAPPGRGSGRAAPPVARIRLW